MRKNIIFHVGLPKTGTTTIQRYLRSREEKLHSLGFLYPGPRDHEAMHLTRHAVMMSAMIGRAAAQPEGLDLAACRESVALVFKKFRESDLKNLLWSCEGMALNARAWDTQYLEQILDNADVRIVFFARYVDDWVESY